jgi:hypothetical protein
MLTACAKPYHFYVKYDGPESMSQALEKKVYLKIIDGRETKSFLSEAARNEFDLWDGAFALYYSEKKPKSAVDTYTLTGLIQTIMAQRLESKGIMVVDQETNGLPVFEMTLKKLYLELQDRTWVSDMSYEVKLSSNNLKTGRETVSGKAERTKVMGRGAGEILVSELLTDTINRLDIDKLFKNAGL